MNCKICNNNIPSSINIDGKIYPISRSRTKCFDCSPFVPGRTKPTQPIEDPAYLKEDERQCKICGRAYSIKPDARGKCRGRFSGKCWTCTVNHRRFEKIERARQLLGGKCAICGYDKCSQALVFHHNNPDDKNFNISSSLCRSWKVIKEEVLKCTLLCCRCHTELHYEQDSSQIKKYKFDITDINQQHKCIICDKVFYSISHNSKYCSSNCKYISRQSNKPTLITNMERKCKEKTFHQCKECQKDFLPREHYSQFCSSKCYGKSKRKVERPTKEILELDIAILSWCAIGRKYGVTDNAVRKWARSYELIK